MPSPHFSRCLIECWGGLTSTVPQPTAVIWAWLLARCGGSVGLVQGHVVWGFSCGPRVQKAALSSAAQAVRKTSVYGKADAIENLILRTLMRTWAPILNSFRRMVPHVASAKRVAARAMRRNALIRT